MFAMLKALPILIVIAMAGYGYHTVEVSKLKVTIADLEKDNSTLRSNQNQLEIAAEERKESLRVLTEERERQEQQLGKLTLANNELQQDKDRYLKIFKDHNITRLARAKPGLIERRINSGTQAVLRQVEQDTAIDE